MAARKVHKPKNVPTLLRWSSTLLVMSVYFALGIVYIIPGPTMLRLALVVGVPESTVAVGFGMRSVGRLFMGHLTRKFFRTRMASLGYCFVAVVLLVSTASLPWAANTFIMLAMFTCHGICFAYVKNTSRMILRELWAQRLQFFIRLRNYFYLAGAVIGPFLPPITKEPFLPQTAYLLCNYQKTGSGNSTNFTVTCVKNAMCPPDSVSGTSTTITTDINGTESFTRCTELLSPDRGVGGYLNAFEINYVVAGWLAFVTGVSAAMVLYYYQKAIGVLTPRRLRTRGGEPQEYLTGTKLDKLPAIMREPVESALGKVGLMKLVPKTDPPDEASTTATTTTPTSAPKKKWSEHIPKAIREPVANFFAKSGLSGIPTEATALVSDIGEMATAAEDQVKGKIGAELAKREKELLEGEQRAKSGNINDLKGGTLGKVAAEVAGVASPAKVPGAQKGDKSGGTDTRGNALGKAANGPFAGVDEIETPGTIPQMEAGARPQQPDDDDDDDDEFEIEDAFQIMLALFMAVVMGLSNVITYANFIAKYVRSSGESPLEGSLITLVFNAAVTVGCTVVIVLYKKFTILPVVSVCCVLSTITSGFLCFFAQYTQVVWSLTAVFGLFSGKVQEGVEDVADDYDILDDEFEGLMDKGESFVLAILPIAMGYLMARWPKSLFYTTFAAFGVCTILLIGIHIMIIKLEKRRKQRDEKKIIDLPKAKSCPSLYATPDIVSENREKTIKSKRKTIQQSYY